MTYQHKKNLCAKETRDILTEHVLEIKKTEYAIIKGTQAEAVNAKTSGPNVIRSEEVASVENLEDYSPPKQMKFKSAEVKERFEKKKKKRNYLEFRNG